MHSILDYIMSHADGDRRPYVEISILGTKMLGLLDSGATHTFMNDEGWRKLQSLGFRLAAEEEFSCTVRNKEK